MSTNREIQNELHRIREDISVKVKTGQIANWLEYLTKVSDEIELQNKLHLQRVTMEGLQR